MSVAEKIGLISFSLCVIFSLRTLFRYISVWQQKRFHRCGPATMVPNKFPYLGLDFQRTYREVWTNGQYVAWTCAMLDNPGKTTLASVWGTTWVFTAHPDNIRQIHSQAGLGSTMVVGPSRKKNNDWLGDGSFVNDGPRWKLSRSLFKPIFSRLSTAKLDRFQIHVGRCLDLVPEDGVSFDLQPMMKRLFLDTSFELILGVPADSQLGLENAGIDVLAFESSLERALLGTLKGTLSSRIFRLRTKERRDWQKDCNDVQSVFDEHIDRRLRNDQSNKQLMLETSMLDTLLEHSRDPKFIRDEMLSVYLGAKDTAAIGMSDVFFQLARNPSVWNKLRAEILEVDKSTPLTTELLKSLKYLQYVLLESLRLFSPLTTTIRTPTTDCVLPRGGGESGQEPIFVPRGSRVEVHFPAVHRDKSIWGSDADQFIPERWQDSRTTSSWEYVPFSGGERMCPAQQMIMTQYGCLLVMFVRKFERLENRDAIEAFEYQAVFSVQSKNGVQVAVYREDARARK